MNTPYDYPDRVTHQDDGAWYWECVIDKEYERKSYKDTVFFCGILAGGMLIFSTILSLIYHQSPLLMILVSVGFFLIAAFICWGLDRLPGEMKQNYRLTEEYIRSGTGKGGAIFEFSRTKEAIFNAKYIELRGRFGGPRIYVPEEDMPFVKDFILCRLPGDAVIRYE